MKNVKRIFFLGEKEVKALGDVYLVSNMPHYELEDGTILYTKAGGPANMEHWVEEIPPTSGDISKKGEL